MVRKILLISLFNVLFVYIIVAQYTENPLRIGLIADPQYADKTDGKTRFYRKSLQKLDVAVEELNQGLLDMTIVLGDMVDEGPKDVKPVIDRLRNLTMPYYLVLGNHDYPKEYQANVFKEFGMSAEYYAVDKGSWKFLFLNTNELSSYATLKDSPLATEYIKMTELQESLGRTHLKPWNGGVGENQMKWIVNQLDIAAKQKRHVLVFTHHPLYPEVGYEALNNRELLALFEQRKIVKAVISGHNHAGNFMYYKELPCITLEGMIETADQNSFGKIELFSNKLIIHGSGRMTSRTIDLR